VREDIGRGVVWWWWWKLGKIQWGYVSDDWSVLIDPRIPSHASRPSPSQSSSMSSHSSFLFYDNDLSRHCCASLWHITTPSRPMRSQCCILFPCIHSHVFHFGLQGSPIQPLWLRSWPIGCSTNPTVLHEANPPGQVLMPVYLNTSEGLMKTSSYPPWRQYVFHLSIFDCSIFVLAFIRSVRDFPWCWRISLAPLFLLFSPNAEQVSLLSSYLWVIVKATLVYIVGSDV